MIRIPEFLQRVGRLVLIVVLGIGFLPAVQAQDASQAEQENTDQQTTDDSQAIADNSEELILAETDEEEESPDRFIPTEEISQDLGVSFPVDI